MVILILVLFVDVIQVWYCVKIVPENGLKVLKSGWIKELLLLQIRLIAKLVNQVDFVVNLNCR